MFFEGSHSGCFKVTAHCGFDLISLRITDTRQLFMCQVAISISFLGKCLLCSSSHFYFSFCFPYLNGEFHKNIAKADDVHEFIASVLS